MKWINYHCKHSIAVCVLQLFLFSNFVFAQEEKETASSIDYLPILYYTPETDFAFGALVSYNFYTEGKEHNKFPSNIMPDIIYTLNNQIIAEFFADIYWGRGDYHFQGMFAYQYFPDKFYGIGSNTRKSNEEDFTKKVFNSEFYLTKNFFKRIDTGIQYKLQFAEITEYEEGKQLIQKNVTGSDKGLSSGAGFIFSFDTRDNKYYPSEGMLANACYMHYGSELGSDYHFNHYLLDYRFYQSLFPENIIALNAVLNSMTGNPPFQMLPALGGPDFMRGYYEGRYRDRNSLIFQAEYRTNIWWRFGAVLFAGVGNVADKLSRFRFNEFKYSYGAGIRYMLNKQEKLNIRLDIGFVKGGSGLYITLAEAF